MWYKWAKRILAGIGLFLALVFGLMALIIWLYEDEIKQYAVEQLNRNLKVDVEVEEIDLTLFDNFPSASLRFTNTFIADANDPTGKDTMLYAETLYFDFNFWDMLGGDYKVSKVAAENAVIKLRIDTLGQENYNIWISDSTAKQDDKFSFALEEVELNQVRLLYQNGANAQDYRIHSEQINFTGDFSNKQYDLTTESDLHIDLFESNTVTYVEDKEAAINVILNIDRDSSIYTIDQAAFAVEDLEFDVTGNYSNRNDSSMLDLNIKGRNIDLEQAFTIFPEEYFEFLMRYDATGMLVFETDVTGLVSKTESPEVKADFHLENGSMTEKSTGAHLSNLSLQGHFESKSEKTGTELLKLTELSANLEDGTISGDVSVQNFAEPEIVSNLKGQIKLERLAGFINSKEIKELKGNSSFDTHFSGVFKNVENVNEKTVKISQSNGYLKFSDASFQMYDSHIRLSDLNGKFSLKKNNAAISGLTGKVQSSQFKADGIFKNFLPFLMSKNQVLTVEADFRSKAIQLDEILASDNVSTAGTAPSAGLNFPENINLNLKAHLSELNYGKFSAKNLKGIVKLRDRKLSARNVTFNANKGRYIVSSEMEQTGKNEFFWTTDATVKDIDIRNFFDQLDNFGQDYLTGENLKGRANISLSMGAVLDGHMNIDQDRLYATTDISLRKGELINQQSLQDIANYLHENKLVRAAVDTELLKKKLKHVKFSELKNTIEIKDRNIIIPKMTIKSNVMDLGISGMHGFNDDIDYHFNFRLREVLVKNKNQEEFGPVIDDGLGVKLFLHMYGNLNDPHYELDKEERKLERKEAIAQEKVEFKSILKQEFGLFKKDSTVPIHQEKKAPEATFEVEWDEFDDQPDVEPDTGKEKKKDKNKGINKFLKKIGVEEEEKKKVQFDIEK